MIPSRCHPSRLVDWTRRAFTLDARSLAIFRMALGVIVSSDAMLRTRDFSVMFGPDGMFPLTVLREFQSAPCVWSAATWIDASWWGGLVLAVEGLAGASLAVGAGTQLATAVAWLAVVSVVRRTAPATNGGDLWLACLLFWGMFLPLGRIWSLDALAATRYRRKKSSGWYSRLADGSQSHHRDTSGCATSAVATSDGGGRPPASAGSGAESGNGRPLERAVFSAGSVALVLQIMAVYLASGLSKCNASWLSGDAISLVLSVHDHGTRLGEFVAASQWLTRPATWAVLAIELAGPCLLLAVPRPRVRLAIAAAFILFHASIAALMSVGLFAYVGMAAWLALLPASVWPGPGTTPLLAAAGSKATGFNAGWPSMAWQSCCVAAGCLALASLIHHNGPWHNLPLPRPVAAAINICCVDQDWGMFGEVLPQEQWVYARGELADGRVVDVLRGGRPLEAVRPADGFLSLPHHRWHKLFWELPRQPLRIFSPSIAAALARQWNEAHTAGSRLRSLEIRYTRQAAPPAEESLHELLLATWPPRDGSGRGNLDRLLDEQQPPSRRKASTAGNEWSRGEASQAR
jgi:hypothetical protein